MKPSELSNFEFEARIRRYRCLALAAQKYNIDHLFTGHHRDDQVETMLMRLIRSKTPSLLGLQGMPSSSPIPYCEDLFPIPNQEPPAELQQLFGSSNPPQRLIERGLDSKPSANATVKLTTPREVTLHRPLLAYPKTDLVAACDSNRIPYVVDKTNIDPTFTQRNAVRALRSRYKLPTALHHDSILALSERARMQISAIHQRGTRFLRGVSLRRFDLGSGIVHLSIPFNFAQLLQDDRIAAANVLQRLCNIVSASEASRSLAPSTVLEKVAKMMTAATPTPSKHSVCSFVYSKVLFEATRETGASSVTWRLSRAPFDGNEVKSLRLPFKEDLRTAGGTAESTSESVLWDGRYWVQLHSSHRSLLSMVEMRSYRPNAAEALGRAMTSKERKELQELLRRHAQGKIRYTLPVLTLLDQIIAFPTLSKDILVGQNFNDMTASAGPDQIWLKWDVSYKVITEPIADWCTEAVVPSKTQRDAT